MYLPVQQLQSVAVTLVRERWKLKVDMVVPELAVAISESTILPEQSRLKVGQSSLRGVEKAVVTTLEPELAAVQMVMAVRLQFMATR